MSAAPAPHTESLRPRFDDSDLVVAAKAGDARARTALVQAHSRFLWMRARYWARKTTHTEAEDFFAEGVVGFLHALGRFDPDHGVGFLTYASHWIDHAMHGALIRDVAKLSGHVHVVKKASIDARRIAMLERDGYTRAEAIAIRSKRTKTPAHVIAAHLEELQVIGVRSLDQTIDHHSAQGGIRLVDTLPGRAPPMDDMVHEAIDAGRVRERVARFRTTLSRLDQAVLDRRLLADGESATCEALAGEFGVSKQRVHQVETKLIGNLSELLRDLQPVDRAVRGRVA